MGKNNIIRKSLTLGLAVILAVAWSSRVADAVRPEIDTTGMASINLDVQGASVESVLRMFSEFSGVNIISGPEVEGDISAKIQGVPWLVALDTLLRTNGYGWERMGDIVRVTTLERIANERLNEEVVERKREDFLPLETDIIKVSYAKAEEMKTPLEILLSSRGKIETDERTNALLITDIESRIAQIRDMAAILDFKTAQVEINAKLVDVDSRHVRDLGIEWSIDGLNAGEVFGEGSVTAPLAQKVGEVMVGVTGTDGDFTATLDLLARQDKAKIISNPRITTADNKEAKILVGKKIPLVIADEAGNAITELTTIGIKLKVVPRINQDNRITLDIHPEVSDLSSQATVQGGIVILTSEAITRVIVEDGQTAVIGGLIRTNESTVETGIPLLMDIPLLGYLFKSQNKVSEDRELLIFVTPTIIRPEA